MGHWAARMWADGVQWLPRGGSLPLELWQRRHRSVILLLVLHVPALMAFALVRGAAVDHALVESLVPAVAAALASVPRLPRGLRSIIAGVGLMATSSVLVHLAEGSTEAHFHFFLMVPIVAMYEDWRPFGLAIGYVLVHHGLLSAVDSTTVFAHQAAQQNPWLWAGIHAAFIAGSCMSSIVSWRTHEVDRRSSAELSHRASHDQLTGLRNRSTLEREIEEALHGARTLGEQHLLCVVDLDGFKVVNDNCGHLAGDNVLRDAAVALRSVVREGDSVGRWGGDEFAVLLRGCSADQGQPLVERIRLALMAKVPGPMGSVWLITASIGVTPVRPEFGSVDDVVHAADMACYVAKRGGRNRTHGLTSVAS